MSMTAEILRMWAEEVIRVDGGQLSVNHVAETYRAYANTLEDNAKLRSDNERFWQSNQECLGKQESAERELAALREQLAGGTEQLEVSIQNNALIKNGLLKRAERAEAQLAQARAEIAALKERIKQIEREHKDAMRDVAAEASRAARFPDEPYGTY